MTSQLLYSRLLAILFALLVAVPGTASAADPAEEAADFYNQATVAYQNEDYQKAADLLDQAFGKNPDLVYKYNRILALQALGDYTTALAELKTMMGPMKADAQNRFEDVEQIQTSLEAAIASQTPEDEPEEITPPPEPPPKKGPNILAFSLIGGGVVALTTGALFASGALLPRRVKNCVGFGFDEDETADCEPYIAYLRDDDGSFIVEDEDGREFEGGVEDARDIADSVLGTHKAVAVTLMAGGAVLGAVGAVLLVLDSGDDAPAASSVRLLPYISHDGAGAAFTLRF